jgi:hypothetical protein
MKPELAVLARHRLAQAHETLAEANQLFGSHQSLSAALHQDGPRRRGDGQDPGPAPSRSGRTPIMRISPRSIPPTPRTSPLPYRPLWTPANYSSIGYSETRESDLLKKVPDTIWGLTS